MNQIAKTPFRSKLSYPLNKYPSSLKGRRSGLFRHRSLLLVLYGQKWVSRRYHFLGIHNTQRQAVKSKMKLNSWRKNWMINDILGNSGRVIEVNLNAKFSRFLHLSKFLRPFYFFQVYHWSFNFCFNYSASFCFLSLGSSYHGSRENGTGVDLCQKHCCE